MISQSLYHALRFASSMATRYFTEFREEWLQFYRPYVLVIHRFTGDGFYLDREYRHIIDVSCCKEPKNPIEVAKEHLCAGSNLPAWVSIWSSEDFDSFWLY